MAKTLNLLLLDAMIVIYLFELGLWEKVVEVCDIHLARIIVDEEGFYYEDSEGLQHPIDLSSYEESGAITVFEASAGQMKIFRDQFDQLYIDQLHDGETESLVYLTNNPDCLICSSDKIVFMVLGNLGFRDNGISLEEVLDRIGVRVELRSLLKRSFREKWTHQGFVDRMSGLGRK